MNKIKKGIAGLALGALGVVFGDIGTSPLYAVQAIFGPSGQQLKVNQANVYGIISLVIWAVTIVVAVKYLSFIMRVDNKGEGGIMALVALIKRSKLHPRSKGFFILLGIVGVSLFYGDSAITPAISVLSAVEGLQVVAPGMHQFVVPLTLVILTFLFAIQKYGTSLIGRLFGPVMLIWFMVIGAGGVGQIIQHPGILHALSPLTAVQFFSNQPVVAFVAMGAVVLAVTGAEALYADMGHFGRAPIARAWFWLVFPALIACYMGQGALMLVSPSSSASPFFLLFPESTRLLVVMLAAVATLIASQSVISGAFSLTRQAVQLGFLPKMLIRHTSDHEQGQIYMPLTNILLYVVVALFVILFGSAQKLATAYGIAVSGTLAIDSLLFIVVIYGIKRKSINLTAMIIALFVAVDMLFVASNLPKIFHRGWLPIVIALILYLVIDTWMRGQRIVVSERKAMEGPLQLFIDKVRLLQPPIVRVPGQAVYIGHHHELAPLALHAAVEELHELHEKVVVLSVKITTHPHIPEAKRYVFDSLGYDDGISHVSLSYGYHDVPNIPKTLESMRSVSPELDFDQDKVAYFISQTKVVPTKRRNLARWRKSLYIIMARNSLSSSDYFKLPIDRTIELRSLLKL